MQGALEKKNGEDGLPIPPYAVDNIGGVTPENLLYYINTLQEELVRAGVLPADYDFDVHKELLVCSLMKRQLLKLTLRLLKEIMDSHRRLA